MDVRTASLTVGPTPSRLFSREIPVPRATLRGAAVRAQPRGTAPPNSVAGTGDYERDPADDANRRAPRPASEEETRKRVEVVTSLLREGYGVGAILTAAAFRGAAMTTEALKGFSERSSAAIRRTRRLQTKRPLVKRNDPSLLERLQQTMTESLATPIRWRSRDDHVLRAQSEAQDETPQSNELLDEESGSTSELAFEDGSVAELREREEGAMVMKQVLGIPEDEPLSSRHISEGRLTPSAFLRGAEEGLFSTAELRDDISAEHETESPNLEETSLEGLDVADVLEDLSVPDEMVPIEETKPEVSEAEAILEDAMEDVAAPDEVVPIDEVSDVVVLEDVMDDLLMEETQNLPSEDTTEAVLVEETELALPEEAALEVPNEELPTGEPAPESEPEVEPEAEASEETLMEVSTEAAVIEQEPLSPEPLVGDTSPVVHQEEPIPSMYEAAVEEEAVQEGDESSLVMNRAQEILDEIANFEIEIGESVDENETKPEPVAEALPPVPQKSKAEIEKELKEEMRREAEKRLRAMKIGNEPRYQRESPVKVERPASERDSKVPVGRPSKGFKGLDYIKSYAKESQEQLRGEASPSETSKDTSAAFFTPPSILQDPKKPQTPQASSGYSQWTELDRLKRVREIGTVMWRGRGGNGGGGNGGSGGGGSSGDGSDDGHWWIQVGVSMMTMTALVFALLTAVSNQLEKQQRSNQQAQSN